MTTETATQEPTEAATDVSAPTEAPPSDEPEKLQEGPLALMKLIERVALSADFDVAKLEHLLTVKERWEANEARKAFDKAMAAFKKNPPEIVKDTHVSFRNRAGDVTEYDHATLDQVSNVIGKALAEHGLAHSWKLAQNEKGLITVTCIITHQGGHSTQVSLSALPDTSGGKNAIQATSSAVTYLERITILAATGSAAAGMDDDGAGSGARTDGASVPTERPSRDQYKGPPAETDLGEPFTLVDEFGNEIGVFVSADNYLDAASKYIGRELSAAEGSASAFHDHNQETLDRINEVLGGSRANTKVASFWRLLNGKKG